MHFHPTHPRGSLRAISPLREGTSASRFGSFRSWSAMPKQSDVQPVGERVVRRREAALNGLPARIVGAGATPGRRAASCENTLAAMPHQALWAGGRSRHGPSGPCATTDRATGLQDVAAPRDRQERRCASPVDQSVNRPLTSFAHSNTGLSRVLPVAWPVQRASRKRGWRQNVGPRCLAVCIPQAGAAN